MKTRKFKVLFVCLGNICRSPLAEGIFRKKIREQGLEHALETDSCGTGDYHIGKLPDHRTRSNAQANGVELDHRCRQITPGDLEDFDLVLAMDNRNHQHILSLSGAEKSAHKVCLMRQYDPRPTHPEVPDPYYGQERDFQEVCEILERSVDGLISDLRTELAVSRNQD